ncbi:MAG: DUF1800 domain-containing protein [Roseateles sp.]
MRLPILCTALLLALAGCASAPPAPSAQDPARDTLWLDRLTWGARSDDLARLRALGRAAWLDEQLGPAVTTPLPEAAQAQIDALPSLREPLPAVVRRMEAQRRAADALTEDAAKAEAQKQYQQALTQLARHAASRQLLLALYSPRQVQEQLTWFWFNHFNVHQFKHNLRAAVGEYEQGLRERALGRFRDLLGYTARHPAMLRYLDNDQNAANRLNENYARELLELHTLGVDGGYSQRDVQELARVLTGLGVTLNEARPRLKPEQEALYRRDGLTEFHPARHDFGDKQLLGMTVKGRGEAELDQVLDLLARHPSTARHVSRKLAQYFVADQPPAALVERMARRWQHSDGRIADVLRTMVESPEFEASLGRKFKDPTHFVVSAVRAAYADKVVLNTGPMIGWLYRLGQAPYNRATPDGYPLDENAWAGPGQMTARFEIARAIGSGSAGLFKPEGEAKDRPAFPQLAQPLYYEGIAPRLAPATRQALAAASSPQEWNTYLLASPDFMHR